MLGKLGLFNRPKLGKGRKKARYVKHDIAYVEQMTKIMEPIIPIA